MTTFGCPECGRNWQEGPTRDYTENYLCRKCIEALARETGEALEMVQSRYIPSCDALPQKARTIHHDARDQVESILTKLRAAEILKGGE